MTDVPAPLPDRLADAEGELPEEIVKAIENLTHEAIYEGGRFSSSDGTALHAFRAALDATILARLTAAESAREAAVSAAEANGDALAEEIELHGEAEARATDALARAERAEAALEPLWQRARAPGAERVPDDATVTVFMKDCRDALAALAPPAPSQTDGDA